MTHLIYNCALYVILSSALPLLVKVLGKVNNIVCILRYPTPSLSLGITNFDLLGNYGKIRWLGNYIVVFAVNALFGGKDQLQQPLFFLLIQYFFPRRSRSSLSV